MSTVFLDSFEHYSQAADLALKWTTATGTAGIQTSGGRTGDQMLRLAAADTVTLGLVNPTNNMVGIGFAVKLSDAASSKSTLASISFPDGTQLYELQVDTDGTLEVKQTDDGSSPYVDTSTVDIDDGEWHYIEFWAANRNTESGSYFKVWHNGTAIADLTSGTADNVSASQTVTITLTGLTGTTSTDIDDFYAWESQYSIEADSIENMSSGGSGIEINCLFPDGDGSVEWIPNSSPNWSEVDDQAGHASYPDDDTSFVHTDVVGNNDLYTMDNPPASSEAEWKALQHIAFVKNSGDTGTLTLRAIYRESKGGPTDLDPSGAQDIDIGSQTTYIFGRTCVVSGPNQGLVSLETQEYGMTVQTLS